MSSELLYRLLEGAFVAGGVLAVFRRVVRDLNGLGKRVREDRLVDDNRYLVTVAATLAVTEDAGDRKWLAEKFMEAGRRHQ